MKIPTLISILDTEIDILYLIIANIIGVLVIGSMNFLYYKVKNIIPNGDDSKKIKTLVKQSSRYILTSEQDKNPYISLLHADYATGYYNALRDIYDENQISSVINDNINELGERVKNTQDKAIKKFINGVNYSQL